MLVASRAERCLVTKRSVLYLAVSALLVTMAGLGTSYARPVSQTGYDYFGDETHNNGMVGQGATNCYTGSFEMFWGVQSPHVETWTERCSQDQTCRSDMDCPYNYQRCVGGVCQE